MEILTLIKANIRHRKGSFFSIMLLMIVISMSLTAILSVQDSCINSIKDAHKTADTGNIVVSISDRRYTDNLKTTLENHELVSKVIDYTCIISDKAVAGDVEAANCWFMLKLYDKIKLFNDELTAYEDTVTKLESGEIYITQGIMTQMNCKVGDKLKIYNICGEYEFVIKGIVLEPSLGASVIGWKMIFISDEDYENMLAASKEAETDQATSLAHTLMIYKDSDCSLSDLQFRRQLNLDTGIIDNAFGSLTQDMSISYTALYITVIVAILQAFIGILLVIVLIVMGHSISTGIEMDYVKLGILKAQGFRNGKIRLIFIIQYLFAEVIGAAVGMLCAIPLIGSLAKIFQPITAIIAKTQVSVLKSLIIIIAIFVVSVLLIFAVTRQIGKISPVRAVSGGRNEIYFDSRIKAPICKKGLAATLALRQFTSGKRRYIATILVVSLLVFFMITINILGSAINSQTVMESMGAIYADFEVRLKEKATDSLLEEIEQTIESVAKLDEENYTTNIYFSINGSNTMCTIYYDPDKIVALKGRAPVYENEIIITDIAAEELGVKMGDEVTVSYHDKKEKYIVTGYYQSVNDAGINFAMSIDGAKRLDWDYMYYGCYTLMEPEKTDEVVSILNEKHSDILIAEVVEDEGFLDDTYQIAVNAVRAVIYIFSIIFALVVVHMVCSKEFLQEKTDIGIYKSLGFTSGGLRLQFAVRFMIVAIIGSAFGTVISVLFSGKLLSTLLRGMGVSNFMVEFTAQTIIYPIVIICICFFVFAYMASGKIRAVEVRELVVEY